MLDAFQVRFNQVTSIDQLKARVQVMRKEYGVIKDMLKQSGFGWNPVTRMVETTDDVWDAYLKQNKEAKKWRNTTVSLYDQWFELFDGSRVDGRRQQSTLPRVESSDREREPHGSPPHSVHLDSDNEDSAASSPPSLKRSTSKEKSKSKSKRSKTDDEVSIVEAIHAVREEYRKPFVPVSITMIQEAMKIVMTMSELSAAEKAKVSNIIRTGAAYATFLEMDHETRLEWIKLELGR